MTDKEMAEEYCNNEVPFDTTESGEKLYTENDLKNSFLAGLKEGGQLDRVWHDLRKDPKDLPTPSGEMSAERIPVLACTKELGVTVAIRRRHGRAYEWYCSTYDGNSVFLDREIIAWCEIPKFWKENH